MNNKLKIILPVILVSSSAFVLFQIKDKNINQSSIQENNSSNTNKITSTDQITSNQIFQQLSVLPNRCIGCGKCIRIDPSHFEMPGNKAVVVSSKNLDSSNLKLAINNCPGQAITLK